MDPGRGAFVGNTANIPTPIVQGDHIFCSAGYGKGGALLKLTKSGAGVTAQEVYFNQQLNNKHGGWVMIGVVAALLAFDRPLGFVALLGCLALLGMITKNAVILVGQIEAERAAGRSVFDAALEAGATRFRPIMLTALSTVFGMIPIAPTVFWGPMAFAIMGGLFAGTLLTLVFLPALYVAVFGTRRATEPAVATTASGSSDVVASTRSISRAPTALGRRKSASSSTSATSGESAARRARAAASSVTSGS